MKDALHLIRAWPGSGDGTLHVNGEPYWEIV